MSNDRLTELERRLSLAEHEAQRMREQLRALQKRPAQSQTRRDGIVVLLGLVLMFTALRALDTYAQAARPQALTVKAPFKVLDATGQKVLLTVGEPSDNGLLIIGDPDHGGLNLGVGNSGAGYVVVRGADGHRAALIGQFLGRTMGFDVLKPDGLTVAASLALSPRNEGRLVLGDPKSGGVDAGTGKSGAGFLVVRSNNGGKGIDMGQLEGRPMALGVFDESGQELVSLRTDDKRGSVRVMKPAGVVVGGLVADDNGGRITLTGPAGVKPSIVLGADPEGGFVSVYGSDAGAMPVAALQAAGGKGNVHVFNAGGQPIASLSSGNNGGTLQLTDLGGTPMVQAGTLPEHVGIVRTGPASRAPGGLMGVPGSYITGKGN